MESDINEQIRISSIATSISYIVKTAMALNPATAAFAEDGAQVAYITVYTLVTKFSIYMKFRKEKAIMRSQTFYSVSKGINAPQSLNERTSNDRDLLKDSMVAGILAHPGGFYTTVTGGEPGNIYTAQLLVSPPSDLRFIEQIQLDNFLATLKEILSYNNLIGGIQNPDVFTGLDFDDKNICYLLLTSELSAWNYQNTLENNDYYTYENTNNTGSRYDQYHANTLGYLQLKIKEASNNQFDAILPTITNGVPQYKFINSVIYSAILPQPVLYRAIILNEERYDSLEPELGHLTIKTQYINVILLFNKDSRDLYS